MSGLGGLLGVYGSDEDEEQQVEETQGTGQVTLLRDDESGGGLDLSHLTSGPTAAKPEADAAATQTGGQQPPRPQSAASEQHQNRAAEGPEALHADGQLQAMAVGGEQPPAVEPDPISLLSPEMREAPEGECDPAMQARVANWLHLQHTRGKFINDEFRKSRGYRNPEFFAKMVEHLEIQQYGTCFAPEVFDPSSLPPEDYLDALQKEWAAVEARRKAARAAGQGRVEFQKSASQPSLVGTTLKPGLNQMLQQQPTLQPGYPSLPASVAAAAAAAKAAAVAAAAHQQHAQQQVQASLSTAAAVAAAQAKAAQLAAQIVQTMQQRR